MFNGNNGTGLWKSFKSIFNVKEIQDTSPYST